MKKIGSHTIKGQLTSDSNAMEELQLFDGRFDTGYRVTFFEVSIANRVTTSTEVVSAKLATENVGNNESWNWGDNREIAWAAAGADSNGISTMTPQTIIDEDNLIIQDLFIGAYSYSDAEKFNYLIKLDKYEISDWQGALAMVRNRSQA
tara:strand:- start:859 stop:1305 length:447 start_codon:yes stop_codon:yes gene_type:complete